MLRGGKADNSRLDRQLTLSVSDTSSPRNSVNAPRSAGNRQPGRHKSSSDVESCAGHTIGFTCTRQPKEQTMRNSRSAIPVLFSVLALALLLTISLPASAQSSPPSQAAPGQTASPPPQSNPPSGNNQAGQSSQANEDNPLNLTDDQKAKLRPIIMEENQQMEALRNDTTMTQEQKITKANQIRSEASPKIRAILTPEQLQKLAELQRERASQQQNAQPAPPSNSQTPNSQSAPSNSQPPNNQPPQK